MIECKLCGKKYKSIKSLVFHICRFHKTTSQIYYDRFLKKDGEGLCKRCKKETNYGNLKKGR